MMCQHHLSCEAVPYHSTAGFQEAVCLWEFRLLETPIGQNGVETAVFLPNGSMQFLHRLSKNAPNVPRGNKLTMWIAA